MTSATQNRFPSLFTQTSPIASILIIAGVCLLLYSRTLTFDYTYLDDNALILNHQSSLQNFSHLSRIFKEDAFHSHGVAKFYYRPLLTLSFMIDAKIGSGGLWAFHLSNILIHAAAAVLVFFLFVQLKHPRDRSLFFSLIFAVHPMLTQAVAWVPGRNDSLLAIFALAGTISLLKHVNRPGLPHLILHLLAYTLALFTKETAVVIPIMSIALMVMHGKRLPWRWLLVLMSSWAVLTVAWLHTRAQALGGGGGFSVHDTITSLVINSPAVIGYLGKALIPVGLSELPILRDMGLSLVAGAVGIIGIVVLVVMEGGKSTHYDSGSGPKFFPLCPSWVFFHKQEKSGTQRATEKAQRTTEKAGVGPKARTPLTLTRSDQRAGIVTGILWFVLFLAPTLVQSLATPANFSEHRAYVPLIGVLLMLAEINYIRAIVKKRLSWLIILVLAIMTFAHSGHFRNRMSFWQSAATTSPNSAFNWNNLGAMCYLDDKLPEAEEHFRRALAINPTEPLANGNVGLVCMNTGRDAEAERYYLTELRLNPSYDIGLFNLALLYHRNSRVDLATEYLNRILTINPTYKDAYLLLLEIAQQQGDTAEVGSIIQRAGVWGIDLR